MATSAQAVQSRQVFSTQREDWDFVETPLESQLTEAFQAQLKRESEEAVKQGLPAPREALRLVTQVCIRSGIIHLVRSDGEVNYRVLDAELGALNATLKIPDSQKKQKALIQAIVKKILLFPAHDQKFVVLHEPKMNEAMRGADFNAYFKDKFCVRDGRIYRVLVARAFPDGNILMQMADVPHPIEQVRKEAFSFKETDQLIKTAYKQALTSITGCEGEPSSSDLNLILGKIVKKTNGHTVPIIPACTAKDPLAAVVHYAMIENAKNAWARTGESPTKKETRDSTDKKDGT
ncbi:MAG: hypothetical protein ACHQT8_03695 [Chlamydiales bacterium]